MLKVIWIPSMQAKVIALVTERSVSDNTRVTRIMRSVCLKLAKTNLYMQGWGQVQLTKYSSTPSTPNYTKYKYWSSTHFLKKYLSTSSTFISSTSTSTHNKFVLKSGWTYRAE